MSIASDAPSAYAARLRREGAALAGAGALVCLVVLVAASPAGSAAVVLVQLAGVAVLVLLGAPLFARRALRRSVPAGLAEIGSGEPTPLAHVLAVVLAGALLFGLPSDGAGALTFAGGAALVGLGQALLLARVVTREERRRGVRFFRLPGARIGRGTPLAHVDA